MKVNQSLSLFQLATTHYSRPNNCPLFPCCRLIGPDSIALNGLDEMNDKLGPLQLSTQFSLKKKRNRFLLIKLKRSRFLGQRFHSVTKTSVLTRDSVPSLSPRSWSAVQVEAPADHYHERNSIFRSYQSNSFTRCLVTQNLEAN